MLERAEALPRHLPAQSGRRQRHARSGAHTPAPALPGPACCRRRRRSTPRVTVGGRRTADTGLLASAGPATSTCPAAASLAISASALGVWGPVAVASTTMASARPSTGPRPASASRHAQVRIAGGAAAFGRRQHGRSLQTRPGRRPSRISPPRSPKGRPRRLRCMRELPWPGLAAHWSLAAVAFTSKPGPDAANRLIRCLRASDGMELVMAGRRSAQGADLWLVLGIAAGAVLAVAAVCALGLLAL